MIFDGFSVSLRRADGGSLLLAAGEGGSFIAPGASADAKIRAVGGCTVLSVRAALGEGCFDADEALTVHFRGRGSSFMADALHGEFWCRPAFGGDFTGVPARTQALLWREGETWCFLWPLCGKSYNCRLNGSPEGLEARVFSYCDKSSAIDETACLLYGEGTEAHALIRRAALAAESLMDGRVKTRDKKPYPEIFEYLGWCSWDALQIRVSEAGLLEKCDEFREKKIPVRWCILDDMWAHVKGLNALPADIPFGDMVKVMHAGSLWELEADPKRFPHGLGGCIAALHERGMKVGVWFPTTGYWHGLDPAGPLAARLADCLVSLPDGRVAVEPTPKSAGHYFGTVFGTVSDAGADFVKIDNQSFYRNFYDKVYPVGEAASAVHGALETLTGRLFGGNLINCMGMADECMWNRRESAVARCSDDFKPENRAWFAKHILQCSYNSLIQGQFHYSDWDMWWTDDAQAVKNSLCRAISGGPVYVSDKIGRSRSGILEKLCFSDGRLLRADGQATPAESCLLSDPCQRETPFLLFNRANDCGLLAAFNIREDNGAQSGRISPADAGMPEGRYLAVEQVTGESRVIQPGESLPVSLADNDGFRLYLFLPLTGKVTPVGLIDKWVSPKAILEKTDGGVRLYEGGRFAAAGVRAVRTNRRARVEGTPRGAITIFDLKRDETAITYLDE